MLGLLLIGVGIGALAFAALAEKKKSDDSIKAPTTLQGAEYPRIHSDGRVTFRVFAPNAQRVRVIAPLGKTENNGYNGLGEEPCEMAKDEAGFWWVTTPPVVPGFHHYYLDVDGAQFCDPGSKTYASRNLRSSGIDVPEPGVDFYDIKDVPHGEVRMRWYFSRVTNQWRRILVYTPPNYDHDQDQRYPVLYLRHGGGENEDAWYDRAKANFILDNLIAEDKAKPMIIVMNNNYADTPSQAFQLPDQPPPHEISEITIKELIPMIDSTYRTIADRDHRAMAGLSMGSVQTLYIGLPNLDTFSALGVFSRRPMSPEEFKYFDPYFEDPESFNSNVHLFWWGAGTAEEGIYNAAKKNLQELEEKGINSVFVEFPGLSHEWQAWRKSLYDYAQRLFRWSSIV